jgi:hypothetical protein
MLVPRQGWDIYPIGSNAKPGDMPKGVLAGIDCAVNQQEEPLVGREGQGHRQDQDQLRFFSIPEVMQEFFHGGH